MGTVDPTADSGHEALPGPLRLFVLGNGIKAEVPRLVLQL
jgi:hypothetical protein